MDAAGIPTCCLGGAAFVFGAFWGSFANVCIFRIPWGISIAWPSSRCPSCLSPVRPRDNVPVLSWLLLRARCRDCGEGIAARYPMVEILVAALSAALFLRSPSPAEYLAWFAFAGTLVVLGFIDIDHYLLPDVITIPGTVLGVLASLWGPETPAGMVTGPVDSLLGVALGGGLLYAVALAAKLATGKVGFGGGDVKLMAMVGAFLGWKAVLPVIFLSAAQGSVVGVLLLFLRRRDADPTGGAERSANPDDDFVPTKHHIPFGPFIALGALEYLFFGPGIFEAITTFVLRG